jgi:hypothetical protein
MQVCFAFGGGCVGHCELITQVFSKVRIKNLRKPYFFPEEISTGCLI